MSAKRITQRERQRTLEALQDGSAAHEDRAAVLARLESETGDVHRRAVEAGAPASLPVLGDGAESNPHAQTRQSREQVFAAARAVGARTVGFAHPGSAGHELCQEICVAYS